MTRLRRPRLKNSAALASLDGKLIHVVQSNEMGEASFIGLCRVISRRCDDRVRVKVFMPEGKPRPPACRYWKFINWIELDEGDLMVLEPSPENSANFRLVRREFRR